MQKQQKITMKNRTQNTLQSKNKGFIHADQTETHERNKQVDTKVQI